MTYSGGHPGLSHAPREDDESSCPTTGGNLFVRAGWLDRPAGFIRASMATSARQEESAR